MMRLRSDAVVPIAFLGLAGLLAYGPVLNSRPLMDDHLFFAWLAATPWQEAIYDRLTGNWIPHFSQMQMYRPMSGIVQATAYHLFGTSWLRYHLFNLLLHGLAGLLAGRLVFALTRSPRAAWCAGALLLLHPRAVPGVSLIYNFYDPLVACLMLTALLCLRRLRRSTGSRLGNCLGLWGSVALALGTKEVAMPLVAVLFLADILWRKAALQKRRLLLYHGVSIALLVVYLLARAHFTGHPFRTHAHPSAFPLPPHAELWALLWDGVLLGISGLAAWIVRHFSRWRLALPTESAWLILWCGLMLLPAVHFCSQVTRRPWFFDERYWYVPLVPLSVLAGLMISKGSWLSSLLGAGILAFTLPQPLGPFVATIVFFASGPLQFLRYDGEVQRVVAALLTAALAILVWSECRGIRLRADEAAGVYQEIAEVARAAPAGQPIALLNFSESTVEPRLSFNGLLQWLLHPPFFAEDLEQKMFFAYSTWDMPPTNRFRDRKTPELAAYLEQGTPIHVYLWDADKRRLKSVGIQRSALLERTDGLAISVATKLVGKVENDDVWASAELDADPRVYRHLEIRMTLDRSLPMPLQPEISVGWLSNRLNHSFQDNLRFPLFGTDLPVSAATTRATLWVSAERFVDWLLCGKVNRLAVTANPVLRILSIRLLSQLPEGTLRRARHLTYYRHPEKRFEWVGESWWLFEP